MKEAMQTGQRKVCTSCGELKPPAAFHRHASSADGLHSSCRLCRNGQEAARYRSRPHGYKRSRRLWHFYRMTEEDWASHWKFQVGRCASCNASLGTGTPHVDHDHSCCPGERSCGGCVRGLLCRSCNLAIGIANDDPAVLRSMADYLDRANFSDEYRRLVLEGQ